MTMPKSIATAITKITQSLEGLNHDSENKFASYRYVSIDEYYRATRKHLSDNGLIIIPSEEDAGLSPDGKTLKMVFSFHLAHTSGDVWDIPIRRTVYIPYTGAQSCGSAISYAEKFVMRTLFKLPTGENEVETDSPKKLESDAEASVTTPMANDADAFNKSKRGQEPQIDFSYSGAPYRFFVGKEIRQSFTDFKPWALLLETSVKRHPLAWAANQKEFDRVYQDVKDDQYMVTRVRKNVLENLDKIREIANAKEES